MTVFCLWFLSSLFVGFGAEKCDNTSIYRTYDGSCNNLRHVNWGKATTTYDRLLPANYADGINLFATSKNGKPLPNSRSLSYKLFPDEFLLDDRYTLAIMQYGQIVTHDMSLNLLNGSIFECCTENHQFPNSTKASPYCSSIRIPLDDPVYLKENHTCMPFLRTVTTRDEDRSLRAQAAQQISEVNNFMDLSIVYGNSKNINDKLRLFRNGLLKVDVRDQQQWPIKSNNSPVDCVLADPKETCYFASDPRINQNTELTLLQVMLLREHNRLAKELSKLNPHWVDETVFQEARRINIAQHQYISYYELLPILMGEEYLLKEKVLYRDKDIVRDYDEQVDPSVFNEHAQAAFRHFHSLIADRLFIFRLISPTRHCKHSIRLSDWYFRPKILEDGDNFDELARGLTTQKAWTSDRFFVDEIDQYLFRGRNKLGLDLRALDIQRGRDHGLPSYNQMRQFCGITKANTFEELRTAISDKIIEKLKIVYDHPDDIDLVVGGSLENNLPKGLVGPTYQCILLKQFKRTRVADRFWFENGVFTVAQLREIKKTSISRLFCDNGKKIKFMQPHGFLTISERNPLQPCDNLPHLNLSSWKI